MTVFWPIFLVITRVAVGFRLVNCMTDFMTDDSVKKILACQSEI